MIGNGSGNDNQHRVIIDRYFTGGVSVLYSTTLTLIIAPAFTCLELEVPPLLRHHTRPVEADLRLNNRQAHAIMADDGEIAPNATFVHCTPYEPARGPDQTLTTD